MKHGMHGKGDKGGHPGGKHMPETTKDDSQSRIEKANQAAKSGGSSKGGGKNPGGLGGGY